MTVGGFYFIVFDSEKNVFRDIHVSIDTKK